MLNTASGNAVEQGGGGIFNDGMMTITNTTIQLNTATAGTANGGGILNSDGGTLDVFGGFISSNSAARAGGEIENNAGTVRLTNDDLSGNTTGINGGGLHTSGAGMVMVTGGKVRSNNAGHEGGGLWNSSTGSMIVSDTTVSNNLAVFGGGIFILSGTVDISNSTIAANTGEGFSGAGGLHIASGAVTLISTLVADNKLSDEKSDVVRSGGTLNSGFSLIESSPVGTINGTGENNLLDVDPQLGPLEDNGGSTRTHAIFNGSPAINAGSDPLQLGTDQRGEGFKRTVGVGADIGAFEQQRNVPFNSIYAAASGKTDQVIVFDAGTGNLLFEFDAFLGNKAIKKGVTVATGDLDGDGKEEVIVGAGGSKLGPVLKVFNGTNGTELTSFLAYDASFCGGVFVSTGDVNGDGDADIITAPGKGTGPLVRVFSGTDGRELSSFFAFPAFTGGVRVSTADNNLDGIADIIAGTGSVKVPTLSVFDGVTGNLVREAIQFPPMFKGGIFVG